MPNKNYFAQLSPKQKAELFKIYVKDGVLSLNEIRDHYNSFASNHFDNGGNGKRWKALNNIQYKLIPDHNFTKEKTGVGDIEVMFKDTPAEGYEYANGFKYAHPSPGNNVIIFNPETNDEQDIMLDALHIMRQDDPVYQALLDRLSYYADGSDVSFNARRRMDEDIKQYGRLIPGMGYNDYFNNEIDGLLRNMFIEGTPEYIESKQYYPNKSQLREWNKELLPYIDSIEQYLITGEKPEDVLDPAIVTEEKTMSYGGRLNDNIKLPTLAEYFYENPNMFDMGGDKDGDDSGVNEYISKKIAEMRARALEKSRTRTMPAVPDGGKEGRERAAANHRFRAEMFRKWADDIMKGCLVSDYDFNNPLGRSYLPNDKNKARIAYLMTAQNEDDLANAYNRGDIKASGLSCIYTATDNYGEKYREASNRRFAKDPEKYGFIQIPVADAVGGDIIQGVGYVGGKRIPGHGMVFDGTYNDEFGKHSPLFNYSRGGDDPTSIVHKGNYVSSEDYNDEWFNAFRFVGTHADSLRWKQEYESLNQKNNGGLLLRIFDEGGDKENELKNNAILKRAKDEDVSLLSARKDAMSKMFDVTDYIASGLASYYPYYTNTYGFPQSTFYTDASGRVYEYPGGEFYDIAAAAGLRHLPFTDLQKRLPKRDYIGGNGYELRIAKMIPGFVEEVKKRAESYGLNPNLMMRRLIKEGFLRHQATMYNSAISTSDQKNYFRNFDWNAPIQGYGLMGLDYAGDNLLEGRYELKDKNATWTDAGPWKDSEAGGRTGNHRIIPDNMKSALEILAAELAFRREEVKRLYNPSDDDLDAYTNASFNYGLHGKIFKDRDKLVSEYGDYPDYYGQLKESEKSKN